MAAEARTSIWLLPPPHPFLPGEFGAPSVELAVRKIGNCRVGHKDQYRCSWCYMWGRGRETPFQFWGEEGSVQGRHLGKSDT